MIKNNNKGFSLIEMIIVVAIMAILAGLSMVSFNSATANRPDETYSNLVSYVNYSKSLVKSTDQDVCLALIKSASNDYYAVIGVASGDPTASGDAYMNQLRTSFKSYATKTVNATSADGTPIKKVVADTSRQYDLSSVIVDPTQAQEYKKLGKSVNVGYNSTTYIGNSTADAVIIKFRKHDGKTLSGAGTYYFSKYKSLDVKIQATLNESTGVFRK